MPALASTMAMPPPIVPAPTTAADLRECSGVSFGMSGILRDFALGEENMNERFGLLGEEAIEEEFLLGLAAFFEGQFCGSFQRFDGGNRREQTALFLCGASRAEEMIIALSAAVPSFSLRSRVLGAGLPATSRAKATAPAADRLRRCDR